MRTLKTHFFPMNFYKHWGFDTLFNDQISKNKITTITQPGNFFLRSITAKSLSEALIFASTNPQYDDRLFIELQVHYMKIPSSNLGRTCCVQKLFLTFITIFVHNMFSSCSAKRRTSDKDLPVQSILVQIFVKTMNIRIFV